MLNSHEFPCCVSIVGPRPLHLCFTMSYPQSWQLSQDANKASSECQHSDEKTAGINDATLHALHQRHPPAAANRTAVPDPAAYDAVHVTKQDVCAAIRSSPAGSAAGPDGIRPQHPLNLITRKEAGQELAGAIRVGERPTRRQLPT